MKRIFIFLIKILAGLIILILVLSAIFYFAYRPSKNTGWGVNFSSDFASYLGFQPKVLFVQILDELKPKYVRLTAYWENLEANRGKFDLPSTDIKFMLDEAAKRNVKVILVLGHKQPRWPECHHPAWYEKLTEPAQEAAVLNMLEKSVNYFKNFPAVEMWQVENEPYFEYGPNCPTIPQQLFEKEVKLVKSLDTRPIIVTDSGEKSAWLSVSFSGGNFLGSTLYRTVYHDRKGKYITYPLPAFTYRVKAGMLKVLSPMNRTLGVELQAEPWFNGTVHSVPWAEQFGLMNPEVFYDNINYAKRSGMDRQYFWGVEWWYWAKKQGHPEMFNAAKQFFDSVN